MSNTFEKDFQPDSQQTEQTKPKFEFTKDDLNEVFADQQFSPKKLILLLEKQYSDTYKQGVDVWEGYTLEQHTLMVMRQFEKYFGDKDLPSGIELVASNSVIN